MREAICICFCFLLALVPQPPGGQRIGIAGALQRAYAGIERDITQAAEKMPDTDYGSKPTSMTDVRTFAQVIGHIADGHYGTCGSLKPR